MCVTGPDLWYTRRTETNFRYEDGGQDSPPNITHVLMITGETLLSDTKFPIKSRKFVSERFTLLTLDIQTGVVSDEDTSEIWEDVKVRRRTSSSYTNKNTVTKTKSHVSDRLCVLYKPQNRETCRWVISCDFWRCQRSRGSLLFSCRLRLPCGVLHRQIRNNIRGVQLGHPI